MAPKQAFKALLYTASSLGYSLCAVIRHLGNAGAMQLLVRPKSQVGICIIFSNQRAKGCRRRRWRDRDRCIQSQRQRERETASPNPRKRERRASSTTQIIPLSSMRTAPRGKEGKARRKDPALEGLRLITSVTAFSFMQGVKENLATNQYSI